MNCDSFAPDIPTLPAHVVSHILQYLKIEDFRSASQVCKLWYYASNDPKFVKNHKIYPEVENFADICKSNRRYGVLILDLLPFDKDDEYLELFEKLCPFANRIELHRCDLKLHHLYKLLEVSTNLDHLTFVDCQELVKLTGLFPGDCAAKTQILTNLTRLKSLTIKQVNNIPLMADLVRFATNLHTFSNQYDFFDEFKEDSFAVYFKILENDNIGNLKHLKFTFAYPGLVDDFMTSFLNIQNLNLKSLKLTLWWNWKNEISKLNLFYQFIMKLKGLEELYIDGLSDDQLLLICTQLVDLRSLDCHLQENDQPLSVLTNLKQLQKLRCNHLENTHVNLAEIDCLLNHKFEHLQVFELGDAVSESNLVQFSVNHPNLIELKLTRLQTLNLEIIFQHLTKLRKLYISFDYESNLKDSDRQYEYKVSRLHDLEEFFLCELINGVQKEDVLQLKYLNNTNLFDLFIKMKK